MKRAIFAVTIILVILAGAAAQEMTVRSLSGRVQYSLPGGGGWTDADVGMVLPLKATIATGFQSRAVLEAGSSRITVQPLTRMTLEELQGDAGEGRTNLTLRTGRIQAEVRTEAARTTRFEVRSPVATAAVRGTDFSFNGFKLVVREGNVVFGPEGGRNVSVPQGGTSDVGDTGIPQEVVDAVLLEYSVNPKAIPDQVAPVISPNEAGTSKTATGDLVIVIQ